MSKLTDDDFDAAYDEGHRAGYARGYADAEDDGDRDAKNRANANYEETRFQVLGELLDQLARHYEGRDTAFYQTLATELRTLRNDYNHPSRIWD